MFTQIERGLLRSLWGADEDDWVTLPGPADWWPDNADWYLANGFEVRTDLAANFKQGLVSLLEDDAPAKWQENMLHDNAPYDIVWHKFFSGYGFVGY